MLQWLLLLNSKVQVKTHIQTNLIYLYILFTIQFIILEISMIYDKPPALPATPTASYFYQELLLDNQQPPNSVAWNNRSFVQEFSWGETGCSWALLLSYLVSAGFTAGLGQFSCQLVPHGLGHTFRVFISLCCLKPKESRLGFFLSWENLSK